MSESKAVKENRFFKDLPNTGKGIIVGRIVDGIYRPPLLHRLLKPRISGNELNGLGESAPRRVGKVYHWVLEGPRGYTRCKVCTQHCPPQAMLDEKQLVRGVKKWYVDFNKCVPYFNDTLGCGICLAVCPFSLPEKGVNLVAKLARKRQKLSAAESA